MGGELLGIIGKASDHVTHEFIDDPGSPDALHHITGRLFGGHEAGALDAPAALGRYERGRARGSALLVEAVEPVLAVDPPEVGVPDGRGMRDEALLEARP